MKPLLSLVIALIVAGTAVGASLETRTGNLSNAASSLSEGVKEYLKAEKRWKPKGADETFWKSVERLNKDATTLNETVKARKGRVEIGAALDTVAKDTRQLSRDAQAVKLNKKTLNAILGIQDTVSGIQREYVSKTATHPTPTPSSASDAEKAVKAAKKYLQEKGVPKDDIKELKHSKNGSSYDVVLFGKGKVYTLTVNPKDGKVSGEKSYKP